MKCSDSFVLVVKSAEPVGVKVADNIPHPVLAEVVGLRIPIVVLPFVDSALAAKSTPTQIPGG